jgi:hypothetical protein
VACEALSVAYFETLWTCGSLIDVVDLHTPLLPVCILAELALVSNVVAASALVFKVVLQKMLYLEKLLLKNIQVTQLFKGQIAVSQDEVFVLFQVFYFFEVIAKKQRIGIVLAIQLFCHWV